MSWSFSLPIEQLSTGESETNYGNWLHRAVFNPTAMTGIVIFLAALVCLSFVTYLVGFLGVASTKLLFAFYVVVATLMYVGAMAWGNLEQRRSRRVEAAPELVLEQHGDQLLIANVGKGPAVDARITVKVDGDPVHDQLHAVLRQGSSVALTPDSIDESTDLDLYVWSSTQLSDVEYRVDRTYEASTLLA